MRSILLVVFAALATTLAQAEELRIDGPAGPLGGEALVPDGVQQIVVIVPGSGPTDRNGNSPQGLSTDAYKMLAEELAKQRIASIRIDKRGMFSSASTDIDPNKVTVSRLGEDVRAWVAEAASRIGVTCAWVAGHSEGGLVALIAAQDASAPICGLILIAAPGRPLGTILREQLRANPANASILDGALVAIDELERGEKPEFAVWEFTLKRLFPEVVHDFLIDLFAQDPAALIAEVRVPILILQGTRDIQITEADADALVRAQPAAEKKLLAQMTHTLKSVYSEDREANAATYSDPSLPLHAVLVPFIADFIRRNAP